VLTDSQIKPLQKTYIAKKMLEIY